ncbi:phage minor capsid protein [Streptomyces sp. NA04227]|uniref:phage minor capsid protein n=1 Tax=Streptomyces sp. NA04227 TaxID=2742136 RepID=UPI0034CE49B4
MPPDPAHHALAEFVPTPPFRPRFPTRGRPLARATLRLSIRVDRPRRRLPAGVAVFTGAWAHPRRRVTDPHGAARARVGVQPRQASAVADMGALEIGREVVVRRTLPNSPAVDRLVASIDGAGHPAADSADHTRGRGHLPVHRGPRVRRCPLRRTRGPPGVTTGTRPVRIRGINGFVDKAGRNWDMAAYAEMAVRSVTARAAIEGHIDALAKIRGGLVIVSLMRPWRANCANTGKARRSASPHTRTSAANLLGSRLLLLFRHRTYSERLECLTFLQKTLQRGINAYLGWK